MPPKYQVVDTNVAVVANRKHGESYQCASKCAEALVAIKELGILVVDDGNHILSEYLANCSYLGQPGVGDSFVRWAHDNIGQMHLVERVTLTYSAETNNFDEFPDSAELSEFDVSDRKFVSVANAHPMKPEILQAADSKWWGFREAFEACGLDITFLCPDEVRARYERKFGR